MKKIILLISILALMLGLFGVDVIIGNGTTTNNNMGYPAVYGGWYKNAREQFLITPGEFAANGGGAGNISSITYNVSELNGCGALPNFTISLGHTAATELTTTFETGLTQVFTTASYQPVVGMNTHSFSTPFNWNGTSSVVVQVTFDFQTGYSYNTSTYYTVTGTSYKALFYRNDSTAWNTVTTGTQSYNRPNMTFNMAAGGAIAPFPANIVSPLNGASYQALTTTLNWTSGGGNPTQYKVYFGTSATPPLVATVASATPTYTPTLAYGQTYYWQIVPNNSVGDAPNCPIWTFSTTTEGLVIIGSGNVVSPKLPINAYYNYTYSQVIYLQSEIGNAGLISSISYYWDGAAAASHSNDWTIYMKQTSLSSFASTSAWIPVTAADIVFSGTVNAFAGPGWITINLPTPFMYDGSQNLMIGVDENQSDCDTSSGAFYCTATTETRGILFYADGTNPDPLAPVAASYLHSNLANVLMQIDPIVVGPPAAPILTYPGNGDSGLPLAGFDLTWSPDLINGGMPDYYIVYLNDTEDDFFGTAYTFDPVNNTHFNPVTEGLITAVHDGKWYWTVEAVVTGHGSEVAEVRNFKFISTPAQIAVNPSSLTESLEHGFTSTQQLTISNAGGLPLDYSIGFADTTPSRSSSITPYDPAHPIVANPGAARSAERSPFIGAVTENESRAIFNLQFSYATTAGEYGVSTDGTYLYTSYWQTPGKFGKYELDGTFIETFIVPSAGGIRDFTYDGQYFYGASNSPTIYIMDFDALTLIGTITAPFAVRGIAYDSDSDGFWITNAWTATCNRISRTGTVIQALTLGSPSNGGLAYDNLSGTPTLWGNAETGESMNVLTQYSLTDGAILQSFDSVAVIPGMIDPNDPDGYPGGGMEIFVGLVPGKASMVCVAQGLAIYGLELCDVANWVKAVPHNGTVAPGGSAIVDIEFDATELTAGVYTGNFTINHNAPASLPVNVPVQLTVTGTWPAVFAMAPASHDFGDVERLNPVTKQFTITNTGGSAPAPLIIAAGGISITNNTGLNFTVVAPGLPVSLHHNETYTFDVIFTPQTLGNKTATLNVADNLGGAAHTAALTGNGIAETMTAALLLNASIVSGTNAQLNWVTWNGPTDAPGWIYWGDGIQDDAIGTDGAATFQVAQKFPTAITGMFDGDQLTSVKFFPATEGAIYTVKIWTGTDSALAPAMQEYEQPVLTYTAGAWNEVVLTTPYPIDGSEALYIGYYVSTTTGFPAGCDAGPQIPGLGNVVEWGGAWQELTDLGPTLTFNWAIQGLVGSRGGEAIAMSSKQASIPVQNKPLDRNALRNVTFATAHTSSNTGQRALQGYKVYRNNALITPTPIAATSYLDVEPGLGTYTYQVEAVYWTNTVLSNTVALTFETVLPYDLPFVEEWNSNNFTAQEWDTSATNWVISSIGDPAPSASFSWTPRVLDYEQYLTSFRLNGAGQTNVTLSFELSLNNFSIDAENQMAVEVWDGTTWNTVDSWSSLDNEGDSFDFTYYSYDISAHAAGHEFKIRFKAYGEDSFEINYWYVDNINVYAMPATLAAPVCTITEDAPDVLIEWIAVPGATWYGLYSAADPYGTYTYLGYLPATYIGVSFTAEDMEFFKVTAGSGDLPRGRMLERGIQQ